MQHYLAPLLKPQSVALVGASERASSVGRTVFENLLAGGFQGSIHAVNPNHRRVFGQRSYASVAAIGKPIDLAVIAAPASAVPGILSDARARMQSAAIMTFPESDPKLSRSWRRDVAAIAAKRGIRVLGPGAFGVVRTDIGLNATFCAPIARSGRLALVAQSGAVCTAMLDFAGPVQMGFSTVASLGGGIDVGFGELLEALVNDPVTDGILLYVETVGDARLFMSALRKAARTKPVVVLKAGRSHEQVPGTDEAGRLSIAPDAVFDAAMMRAGTVRVRTYTQLFAAARILARGRIPRGDRLAIVSNGRGPAILAADSAETAGVALARFAVATERALDALLPNEIARGNPVDVRGDAPPSRFAAAVASTLSDPNTDAVLALHVPRPIIGAIEAAHAVAAVARDSLKPVLGAWLGAVNRPELHDALEAGGIANFYTPENAVDAFAFLASYRRNQEWLLEVPSPQPDPAPPDLELAERVRELALAEGRGVLSPGESQQLLAAFGIVTAPLTRVTALADAQAVARRLHYPVSLTLEGASPPIERRGLGNGRALARAWRELQAAAGRVATADAPVVVQRAIPSGVAGACAITLATDPVFGPVIAAGVSMHGVAVPPLRAVMLPPLNRRLAMDLLVAAGVQAPAESLVQVVLRVSAVACALPWVSALALDPVVVVGERAEVPAVRIAVEPKRVSGPGYRHMAIHPYPVELEAHVMLRDGTRLFVRPIRPEDAEMERRFIADLSEQTRFYRFFYRLHELTPAMLGRFTQVDYDREVALLALVPDTRAPGGMAIIGIARYIANPDHESAEFAVVVADAWHGRGVASLLMKSLIACAKKKGFKRLVGAVLRANRNMIHFSQGLGFTISADPQDPEQVKAELELQ
ncbi:MAG: GNAT family N-acetyltransferase [Burkholderiales bacterium]|nr:GNAT family N-acetyltransferase [Burkholderiales bacterium]